MPSSHVLGKHLQHPVHVWQHSPKIEDPSTNVGLRSGNVCSCPLQPQLPLTVHVRQNDGPCRLCWLRCISGLEQTCSIFQSVAFCRHTFPMLSCSILSLSHMGCTLHAQERQSTVVNINQKVYMTINQSINISISPCLFLQRLILHSRDRRCFSSRTLFTAWSKCRLALFTRR